MHLLLRSIILLLLIFALVHAETNSCGCINPSTEPSVETISKIKTLCRRYVYKSPIHKQAECPQTQATMAPSVVTIMPSIETVMESPKRRCGCSNMDVITDSILTGATEMERSCKTATMQRIKTEMSLLTYLATVTACSPGSGGEGISTITGAPSQDWHLVTSSTTLKSTVNVCSKTMATATFTKCSPSVMSAVVVRKKMVSDS